eukprot:11620979-Heterocapsa_arctica.AAC.1
MGIENKQCWNVFLKLKVCLQLRLCANDERSARNIMAIARMPEDRSNTFEGLKKTSKPYAPVRVHL